MNAWTRWASISPCSIPPRCWRCSISRTSNWARRWRAAPIAGWPASSEPYRDRIAVGGIVPMSTPRTAIAELEYAVTELGLKTVVMTGYARRTLGDKPRRLAGVPARHFRPGQRVRLRSVLGQVRRAGRRAVVAQLASAYARVALGLELRLQPYRRACRFARVAGQVAVPRRRDAALPDAALRLPRRRRGLGLQPVSRTCSATGASATPKRSSTSIPTASMSTG